MTHDTMRPRASWGTAFRAQFRLLWCSRRPLYLFGTMLFMWVISEYIFVRLDHWESMGARLVLEPAWLVFQGVVGAVWGIAVWREQNRTTRPYHWTMPIDVTAHDYARVAAGAVWLLLAAPFFALVGIVLATLHGHGAEVLSASPVYWLAQLTAALIGYLLIVPISTLSGRPAEVVLVGIIAFYGLAALLAIGGEDSAAFRTFERIAMTVFTSRYGLTTPFFGHTTTSLHWAQVRELPAGGFATWLAATLLWLAIGAALLGGAMAWVRRRLAE